MLTTLGIAFLTSHITEVVVAINKRLQNTVLKGDGAFLLALVMAFFGSLVKVFWIDGTPLPSIADFRTWQTIAPDFAMIWTAMQVYFLYVIQKLGMTVQPDMVAPVQQKPQVQPAQATVAPVERV